MVMKPSMIMLSMKISIMTILTLSVFFPQSTMKPKEPEMTPPSFGVLHKTNFNNLNKKNLFFSSLLKVLAILSAFPLLLEMAFKTTDTTISLLNWFPQKNFSMNIELLFDLKFKTFLSVALVVSWSILEFSYYYMNSDPLPNKFFRLLMIFLLKMILLTSTKNLFLLFMGWEGVGFLSFLLMSWWASRTSAKKSAIQAMIYNRMGDMGILLFFSLSITLFNSWSLPKMFSTKIPNNFNNILLVGILLAAAGKSAQFGLHPWLPAAMEGPTPVSALLHSSTMVVAGMFLLIRLGPLYSHCKTFKTWCLILGSVTAIFAATTAISQHDMKKMVAYSTTSQLGLMMVAIGLNQPKIALFHICTHAFFKAMLFLSSGSMIHSLKDEQDIRKMGGLHFLLPNTSTCIVLGSLALSGIPFLAGFYSKDLILEIGLMNLSKLLGITLALLATLLTSTYSLRIIFFCFIKSPTFSSFAPMKEEKMNLTKPLKRLALGTMLSGWALSKLTFLTPIVVMSPNLKILAFFLTILGTLFSISTLQSLSLKVMTNSSNKMNSFSSKQWFYQKMSHIFLMTMSFILSLTLSGRKIDRGWTEKIGAQGVTTTFLETSQTYQHSQTGYIKQYMVFSFMTSSVMLTLLLLTSYKL